MKKMFLYSLFMMTVVLLNSCMAAGSRDSKTDGSPEEYYESTSSTTSKDDRIETNGLASIGSNQCLICAGGLVQYYDWEEGRLYPICSRLNCDHTEYDFLKNRSPECPAAILAKDSDGYICVTEDALWYIARDLSNNKEAMCVLMKSDLNGENARTLFQIPALSFANGGGMYMSGDVLYAVGYTMLINEEKMESTNQYSLYEIDVREKRSVVVKEANTKHWRPFQLIGIYDEKLYYIENNGGRTKLLCRETGSGTETSLDDIDLSYADKVRLYNNHLYYIVKAEERYILMEYDLDTNTSQIYTDNEELFVFYNCGERILFRTDDAWYVCEEKGQPLKWIRDSLLVGPYDFICYVNDMCFFMETRKRTDGYVLKDDSVIQDYSSEIAIISIVDFVKGEEPALLTEQMRGIE